MSDDVRFPNAPLGPPTTVRFHPDAAAERDAVATSDKREYMALVTAVEKLKALGPELPFPHSSSIKGAAGAGLRELRPRSGQSRTRAIYRRFADIIVVLAIGPEAEVDKKGFNAAVRAAVARAAQIEVDQ